MRTRDLIYGLHALVLRHSDTVYRSTLNNEVNMISLKLQAAAGQVLLASDYTEVFGTPDPGVTPLAHVKRLYRQLIRDLHPDRYPDDDAKQLATEAFAKVTTLQEQAFEAIKSGKFGEPVQLMTMRTPLGEHLIRSQLGPGDLTMTYASTTKIGGRSRETFAKIVRSHRDNDLLKAEANALKILHGSDVEQKWRPYVSELVESFIYAEPRKPRRRVNVITGLPGFSSSDEIRAHFPGGIPTVHVVWMRRRLLIALGFAHDNGVIHGAVLPPHVMVSPSEHGIVLVDWCYASLRTDSAYSPLVAIVDRYRQWYPEEVLTKEAPTPATDIYTAARTAIYLLGGNPVTGVMPDSVPRPLRAFFNGCLQSKQSARPQNAWLLLQEFDELLERLGGPYYPRRFREFVVPAGTAKQ